MKQLKKISILVFLILFCQEAFSQQLQWAGIPSQKMNYYAASQQNSNWCWAASLQMIFNYYGVDIRQDQIVRGSYGTDPYGRLPNWTGSTGLITRNLNNWNVDNRGRRYAVQSRMYNGAPTPVYLVQELSAGRPVLIGYRSGANSGHAVVITAVSYYNTVYGPQIQSIVVRDPWPSPQNIRNNGRVEYPANKIASLMMAHWYVRVY